MKKGISPAQGVTPIFYEYGQNKIKAAVIYTSGFAEFGEEKRRKREEELGKISRKKGFHIISPNCRGIYRPKSRMALFPGMLREPGKVGVISRSSSLTILLSRWAAAQGVGFSKMISSGNECGLNCGDFLKFSGDDPEAEIIRAYLEGVKDGSAFIQAPKNTSREELWTWFWPVDRGTANNPEAPPGNPLGGLYLERKSAGALIKAEIPAYPSAERAFWPMQISDIVGKNNSMDEQEFLKEMERIKEDIDDFPWPYSPCEYFHGRERLFNEDQFERVVEFFREYQQKKFER